MLDFEIELTGINDSAGGLLKSACISLLAVDALLSMNISVSDKKKYSNEKISLEQKIKELRLELHESCNPSQMTLF